MTSIPAGVHYDLESGNGTSNSDTADVETIPDVDEYTGLVRFISTYRDPRAMQTNDDNDEEDVDQRIWYMPWKTRTVRRPKKNEKGGKAWRVPDDWLLTELRQGLTDAEVEKRRQKAGWNELTSEKENMLLKFVSYFMGPIQLCHGFGCFAGCWFARLD